MSDLSNYTKKHTTKSRETIPLSKTILEHQKANLHFRTILEKTPFVKWAETIVYRII
jgi:hypothetical protein